MAFGCAVLAGALLALASLTDPASANPSEPLLGGHGGLSCGACHAIAPANDQPRGPDQPDASPVTLFDQEPLCGRCHRGAIEASHPSGFVPSRPLPAAFPLGQNGELTCSSCHRLHDTGAGLLRTDARGRDFCLSCHEEGFFAAMADQGQSLVSSGHLAAGTEEREGLDGYSLRCMSCHAEKGPGSGRQAALSFGTSSVLGFGNHPIGGRYDQAERFGGYRPQVHLSEEVMLPDGRVGCVSCHLPYSREHGRKPALARGLCVECHAL